MGTQKITNKNKIEYTINLVQVFNDAYKQESKELRNILRPMLSDESIKRAFGLEVIDAIIRNTQDGVMANGKSLSGRAAKYSDAYKKSRTFKIYKGGQNKVDLTLTSEMLSSMDMKTKGYDVNIHFVDSLNSNKAHGHITGHDGQWGFKRNFFGLTKENEAELLRSLIGTSSSKKAMEKATERAQAIEETYDISETLE